VLYCAQEAISLTDEKLQAIEDISLDESGKSWYQIAEEAVDAENNEQVVKQEIEDVNGEKKETEEEKDPSIEDNVEPTAEYENETDTENNVEAVPLTITGMVMQEGIAFLESEEFEEALKVFDKVLKHDPHNALAFRKKGAALGKLGRHEEALEMLEKSIEYNSDDATTWHNKIAALYNLGKREQAEEAKKVEKRLKTR